VPVLGKLKKTCTASTPELRERILSVADKLKYQTASGNTVSTNCFYEAQGRRTKNCPTCKNNLV
jgi:purine-nucleoside phosphorylase